MGADPDFHSSGCSLVPPSRVSGARFSLLGLNYGTRTKSCNGTSFNRTIFQIGPDANLLSTTHFRNVKKASCVGWRRRVLTSGAWPRAD